MIYLLNEALLVAFALPLVVVAVQMSYGAYRRLRAYATARCVWRIANMIMAEEEPSDEEMQGLCARFPMGVILDATLFVADKIYGNSLNRLALIIEVCKVDYHLVRRIHRSSGVSRIRHLSKLSALTNVTTVSEYAEDFLESESRETRFYAMTSLVSARPDRAMRYIARFEASLSLYEAAVLTQLLRRAGASIAYTPLLSSQNRNLQMLGIYLSGHFAIVGAEPHLQRLAESEDDEVSYMAVQTLCSIRGDISTSQVRSALQRFVTHERFSFLLHAVQNCYSLRSCAHLLTVEERTLFSQRINSYKCRMVCN